MQEIAYNVMYNHVCNIGETILNEIGFKLGNTEYRKNIYYARFIMLIANLGSSSHGH